MASKYRICIVREDGDPVYLMPGSQGERDLQAAIVDAVLSKSVGILRTKAQVGLAVDAAIAEVLHALKAEVNPISHG